MHSGSYLPGGLLTATPGLRSLSNLRDASAVAPDRVRFTPTHLDIDDLYKLWSMMSGTPFALSLCYLASVVAIDGQGVAVPGRRVETRVVRADPIEVV